MVDILGVFDLGVMAVYLGMGLIPFIIIGIIMAYHKMTYRLVIFENDDITRDVRIWSL